LTMSADLERDSMGNEHMRATLRNHTGVRKTVDQTASPKNRKNTMVAATALPEPPPATLAPGEAIDGDEAAPPKKERRKKKKDKELEQEVEAELEEGIKDVVENVLGKVERKERRKKEKEPVYRPLGGLGLPPPRSERKSVFQS